MRFELDGLGRHTAKGSNYSENKKMGNTVSAAEIVASELSSKKAKFDHSNVHQEIPPECPMHASQKPVATECPVKHDDINPLNMVSKSLFCPIS